MGFIYFIIKLWKIKIIAGGSAIIVAALAAAMLSRDADIIKVAMTVVIVSPIVTEIFEEAL